MARDSCQICGPEKHEAPLVICAACLIRASSIGAGIANIRKHGIDAEIADLDAEFSTKRKISMRTRVRSWDAFLWMWGRIGDHASGEHGRRMSKLASLGKRRFA